MVLLDLYVAYVYMSVFEPNAAGLVGCLRAVRFRGYYMDRK